MARGSDTTRDIVREARQQRAASGGSSGGGGGGSSSSSSSSTTQITYNDMNEEEKQRALDIFGRQQRGEITQAQAEREARQNEQAARDRIAASQQAVVQPSSQDAYLQYLQEQQAAMAAEQKKQAQESAIDVINNLLSQYGLESLTQFVSDMVFKEDITSEAALIGRIRGTDQYKERFKGMELRRQRGLNMPSEAEYIGLENTYRQLMRSAGMPADLFDKPDDLSTLIGYDVSPAELNSRINEGYRAVADSNPEVINQLRRLYGFKEGELAAYFLDPERTLPTLTRQAQSSQIAAEAQLQAGQQITATQAEELAMAGVTQQQAQAGFQTIAGAQELFGPLAGTTETGITQGEQIAGIFGTSAAAQQRIRQRARERTSVFEQGGGFAGQGSTVTGLQ
mgnify:CR=1 FL=1